MLRGLERYRSIDLNSSALRPFPQTCLHGHLRIPTHARTTSVAALCVGIAD